MFSADQPRTFVVALTVGAVAVMSSFSGCLSVSRELAVEEQQQIAAWEKRHAAPSTPAPRAALTWDEALVRLRAGNDKLRATDLENLRAADALRQVQRSLIPQISFQAGYNRALSGETAFDPFSFATSVFFDVPGMIGYKVRLEGAQLVVVRSGLARELAWREQVVELYRAFLENAQLAADVARLDSAAASAASAPASFRFALAPRRLEAAAKLAESDARLGRLIGDPAGSFACVEASLPALGYQAAADRPAAAALAHLPLRLAAVELVALRARELGVTLQNWPELNFYVSSPALYRRNSGENVFWSTKEVFAGANLHWNLDTRGNRAAQQRLLAAEAAFRRETLTRESAVLSQRLGRALAALAETDAQLAALPASSGLAAYDTALAARRTALAAERREWQLVLWFFDDPRWPQPPPAPSPLLAGL